MTNGTVVRSMVLNDGYIIALDDGMISWRPNGGRRTNYRLQYPAAVLLGMIGPTGYCESVIIGDTRGNIIRLSLPKLELLDAYETAGNTVRSIWRVSDTSDRLLVGNDSGHVWLIGRDVPDNCVLLFKHDECITSIKTHQDQITIHSGWSMYNYDWQGVLKSNHSSSDIFEYKRIERSNRRAKLLQKKARNTAYGGMLDLPIIS
tara:strand:- start:1470 stop:2081 length:612 start_codon:yes stop_codon:yes gene_type:complete